MKFEQWSEEHKALVRKMPVARDMPDADFAVFWAQVVQSGLDPVTGQCQPVARQVKTSIPELDGKGQPKKEQGRNGQWFTVFKKETVFSFQATEAGMLARALRFPDCIGIQAAAVYSDDLSSAIDTGNGKVDHVFDPRERKGKLIGAWGRVVREGKLPQVVWLRFGEATQGGSFWEKMPETMITKCARVAAIRKAYPEAFGSVYIAEEMPSESEVREQLEALQSPISGTRKVDDGPTAEAVPPLFPQDDPPEVVEEADAIIAAASELGEGSKATRQSEFSALAARGKKLPRGSAARTRVAKVIAETAERMARPAPVLPPAEIDEAEREADGICADVSGIEPGSPEEFQRLEARVSKMPEGAARARAQAALDGAREVHPPKKEKR